MILYPAGYTSFYNLISGRIYVLLWFDIRPDIRPFTIWSGRICIWTVKFVLRPETEYKKSQIIRSNIFCIPTLRLGTGTVQLKRTGYRMDEVSCFKTFITEGLSSNIRNTWLGTFKINTDDTWNGYNYWTKYGYIFLLYIKKIGTELPVP